MPVVPFLYFRPRRIAQDIAVATGNLRPLATAALAFVHELTVVKPAHHVGDPRPTVYNRRSTDKC